LIISLINVFAFSYLVLDVLGERSLGIGDFYLATLFGFEAL